MRIRNLFTLCTTLCLLACFSLASSAWANQSPIAATGQNLLSQLQNRAHEQGVDLTSLEFIVTTPSNLDDLALTSPLARVTAEELSMWLVQHGFEVKEVRRADAILMAPKQGEIGLTRKPDSLYKTTATGTLLVTGTYTVLSDRVLFHIRVLEADSNKVLAMAPLSLPRTVNTNVLLTRNDKRGRTSLFTPSVKTSLPAF